MADVDTKYMLNAFPYLGKDETRPNDKSLSEFVVLRLMDPFLNKELNVTCDNFFTSVSLAEQLQNYRTSLLGTMRTNRKELPPCARNAKNELHSTNILQNKKGHTLTIYQCKPRKNVLFLSSLHRHVPIQASGKKKPETVVLYNKTKVGVDILDQMARKYSVKPSCRRWPFHVFCNLLDLAAINAWVLYKTVTGLDKGSADVIIFCD